MAFYKFLNSTISVSGSDHLKVKLIIAKSCSVLLITAMPCRITKSLEFWEFSSLLKLFFVCFDHNYGTFFKSMRFNILKRPWGRFIYIIDSSNSSSITFWTSKFGSSSRSNWTGIWTDNGPSINNVGPFSQIYDPPPCPCRLRLLNMLMK